MIKTFADEDTRLLFETGTSRRLPPEILRRAVRKLEYVNLATCLNDLAVPAGNRFHALAGNRRGQYSLSVNDQWRICFRFERGDAYDVQILDYHR
jgi:proteic killer suppression protein